MFRSMTPFLLHFFEGGEGGTGGTDGSGGAGGATSGGSTSGDTGASAGAAGGSSEAGAAAKTFSQDEVNRIVAERVRRERAQFGDYDSFKAKAQAWDEAEEARKTNDQRAQEAAQKRERETAERIAAADRRLIAAEIKMQTAGRVHNPEHVVALLMSDPAIKVKGDSVEGVKEALDTFLADPANAYFMKKETTAGAARSGGEFNGRDTKTLDEQIAEAEKAGDWRRSNVLKLQKARASQS